MINTTTIKDWAEDDRPREKLLQKGINYLSNSELLAILINNGPRNKSAVAVAKELLAAVDNDLQRLGKLSVKEIIKLGIKGIGPAKAVAITAALELGVRRDGHQLQAKKIGHSRDAAGFLRMLLQYKKQESFAVLFLNTTNKVNHFEVVSEGGITGTVADPRIILKKALEHDAVNLILCHNHPSGDIKPSKPDIALTHKIRDAAAAIDIVVLDHIIVGEEGYFSFADEGLL
jgi:DNA repair protein RadC